MLIINAEPFLRLFSDIFQRFKNIHIQNRFPVTPVKAFDKTILHRAARFNKFKFDTVFLRPISNRQSRQFRSVIKSDAIGKPTPNGNLIQNANYSICGNAGVNLDCQRFTIEIIDHVKGAKTSPVPQSIAHKVR